MSEGVGIEERTGKEGEERELLEERQVGDLDSLKGQNIDRLNEFTSKFKSNLCKLLTGGKTQKTRMVMETVVWGPSFPK